MNLRDEKGGHHVFIDSAMVRWSNGSNAGGAITRIADLRHLIDFLEQCEREGSGVLEATHGDFAAA